MRGWSLKAALAFGLVAVAIAPAAYGADAGAPSPPALPACIRVATQARWIPYGYNHVVILENGCSKAATCKVSTDVNPQVQTAEIEPTKTVEVTTIMASPASQFVAKVTCSLH
jgi:hypothetical protein